MGDLVAGLVGAMTGSVLAEFQPTQIAQGIRVAVAVLKQLGQPMSVLQKANTEATKEAKAENAPTTANPESSEKGLASGSETHED